MQGRATMLQFQSELLMKREVGMDKTTRGVCMPMRALPMDYKTGGKWKRMEWIE